MEARRKRRWAAGLVALLVLAAALHAAVMRRREELPFAVGRETVRVVPDGHRRQVGIVRPYLKPGETIFYFSDPAGIAPLWDAGLWERSLYPRNALLRFAPDTVTQSEAFRSARRRYAVRYVIVSGPAPADLRLAWSLPLPAYPGSVPAVFGELRE
jgi:hypothetical protein